MATGLIKTKGQKLSFWSIARQRMGIWKKGGLMNPALMQAKKAKAKVQKTLTR